MKRETRGAPLGAWRSSVRGTMRPFGRLSVVVVALFAVVTVTHAQTSGAWQAQDIGSVAAAGSSSVSGGTFTVAGSGADIWGVSDAFQFYSQTLTGDGSITARVTGLTDTNGWAKAGVMIRESLAANAANVFLTATAEWHGIVAQQRTAAGADTTQVQGPSVSPTYWLRLTRVGSSVTAATSPDGTAWTALGSFTTAMNAAVYIGLAVTSHNDGTLCTATFDNVSVVASGGSSGSTWQSADIGTNTAGQTIASGDMVTLTGSGHDIWNTADGFRYYYQPIGTGDCEVIVHVASLQNTYGWAKAAIMLRASLDPGSPQTMVCVSAEHGTAFQWRDTAGGESQTTTPSEDGGPPRWLKLVFSTGGVDASEPIPASVVGYVSSDGNNWTVAGSYRMGYGAPAWQYIGLAVTSHVDGTLCTAQFDHLKLLTPPPAPTDLRVTHRGPNGEIDLAWNYSTSDVDQFVIRTNRQTAGDHNWYLAATAPGSARQAVIQILNTDGAEVELKALRDLVRSPRTTIWAKPTITPSLAVTATTDNSISLRVTESYGYGGGEYGPWSIERSSDGVSFTEIVSGLTPTGGTAYSANADYADSPLPSGTTRYYRARELRPNGDSSSYSNVVTATTTGTSSPPPSGTWGSHDIGSVAMPGSDSESGGTVTVTGGGADIWDNADSFHFRYQTLSGDGSITARVVSVSEADVWSKAGVMIRNSLSAGARNVFAAVTPTWNGVVAQARTADGGPTVASALAAGGRPPYWVRVTRTGSTIRAQSSLDGFAWDTGTSWTVAMDIDVLVGLAVTSHTQSALCTATFDHVTITGSSAPPPPPGGIWSAADVGAVGLAGSNTASGNTITIDGSGADIWGSADAFRFVSQTRTGDGVIEAQITAMDYTNGWAKAGVMIRASADPGAANVFLAVTPDFHGVVVQWRGADGGVTDQMAGPVRNAPIWLRLQRTGSTIAASWSSDGVTWNGIVGISNSTFPTTAVWGFAVTAHDNTKLNHVVFQDPYIDQP